MFQVAVYCYTVSTAYTVYTATLHSYKRFLLLPLSILRPAIINTLLSWGAICLEQVLYKCPWNKRIHFTTPVPLHRCICITHAPCKEYSPFNSYLYNSSCPFSRPWLNWGHLLNERLPLKSQVSYILFSFMEPLLCRIIKICKNISSSGFA